jgi:hypothetical protein
LPTVEGVGILRERSGRTAQLVRTATSSPCCTTDEGAGRGDGTFSVRDIDPFENQTAGSFLSRYLD